MISVFTFLNCQNNSLADSLENTCESGLSGRRYFGSACSAYRGMHRVLLHELRVPPQFLFGLAPYHAGQLDAGFAF